MFSPISHFRIFASTLFVAVFLAGTAEAGTLSLAQLTTQAVGGKAGEFNSTVLLSAEPHRMAKWQRVAAASKRDLLQMGSCLASEDNCTSQEAETLRAFVLSSRKLDAFEQLQAVNEHFNAWPYRSDLEAYGQPDYWASPLSFLEKAGDCEDYAIVKFVTLLLLGFDERKMKIVAVFDEARGLPHAVLSVNFQGKTYILDNLRDDIASDRSFRSYRPLYSVNFSNGWLHLPPKKEAERAVANRDLE